MKLLAPFLLLCLAGCVGEQRNAMPVQQGPALGNTPPRVDLEPRSEGELLARVEQLRSETQASNNANQQSLSGLGVQVAKVAENVRVTGAEITSNLKADLHATATASADLRASLAADLKAELRAEIRNEMRASLDAQAHLNAALTAKLEALTAGQMGLRNELQQTSQTITASGSAQVQTFQFTRDMADLMAKAFDSNVAALAAACGIVVSIVSILAGGTVAIVRSMARDNLAAIQKLGDVAIAVDTDPAKKETKRYEAKSALV